MIIIIIIDKIIVRKERLILIKKILLLILCMLLLIGCTSPKKSDNNTKNESSTLSTINYISKTALTQGVVGDIEDDMPNDSLEYSDFRKVDCDYRMVITITFHNTEQAPRGEQ